MTTVPLDEGIGRARPESRRPERPDRRLGVLLSEASSLSARHTLYVLGPHYRLGVLDPARLCQGRFSRYVGQWHRSPSFSRQPTAYVQFLIEQIRRHHYDVIFPTHEQVYLLSRFRHLLEPFAGLAVPEFDSLRQMQHKGHFTRLLRQLDLPHPATAIVRSSLALQAHGDYPCWVKLAHGTAGGGVWHIRGPGEMRELAARLEAAEAFEHGDEVIVQQPAEGVQATVQAVFQRGRMVGMHSVEATAIGVGGSAMSRVGAWHPGVEEHVRRLGAHLDWHGAFFLDYFYNPVTRDLQYIECNPRIGETFNAMLSGVNLCDLLVQVALGETVEPAAPTRPGVRTHMGYMILLANALAGAGRRQLMAEWLRLRAGRGTYAGSHDELTRPRDDWGSLIPSWGILAQLMFQPQAAQRIVGGTVENYSLPSVAARLIEQLDDETILAGVG